MTFDAWRERLHRAHMGLPNSFLMPVLGDVVSRHSNLRSLGRTDLLMIITDPAEPLDRRVAAGNRLAIEGDPRIDALDPMLVPVPGGEFDIGLRPEDVDRVVSRYASLDVVPHHIRKEVPRHPVEVGGFLIGRFPVTNFEYRTFLEANADAQIPTSWRFGAYPWWWSNHPVHGVTIEMARHYASWLSAATGRSFRLPTEREWEVAALGGADQDYPWGDEWLDGRANTVEWGPLTTTPVGAFVQGAAACGALDIVGNVEEWVDTIYMPYPGGHLIRDALYEAHEGTYHVARGGSFSRFRDLARCRRRHGPFPGSLDAVGFRLAADH